MSEGEEMSDYIGRMEEVVDRVRCLGEPISERLVRVKLVSGLTSQYDGFRRAWNQSTTKTYDPGG